MAHPVKKQELWASLSVVAGSWAHPMQGPDTTPVRVYKTHWPLGARTFKSGRLQHPSTVSLRPPSLSCPLEGHREWLLDGRVDSGNDCYEDLTAEENLSMAQWPGDPSPYASQGL